MSRVKMDSQRYKRIKSKIDVGLSVNKVSQLEGCSRRTVRQIRDGDIIDPSIVVRVYSIPAWASPLNWDEIYDEIVNGGQCRYDVWEERQLEVSYSQFSRYFNQRFHFKLNKVSTPRHFEPGESIEVDYSGKKAKWVDPSTGEFHLCEVFVSTMGFSQKVFACTSRSQKSEEFLKCHIKMFKFYGGAAKVLVPDNLKSGVVQPDLYDPKINPHYEELSFHYNTVVIPARIYCPRDKSLVEGLVKLVMRFLRFWYRNHTFRSPEEIDEALLLVCEKVNSRIHTRFKETRNERFLREKGHLKLLPKAPYEYANFKDLKVYCDSHIKLEDNYYSVPHHLRGKIVRVRLTSERVEVLYDMNRVAFHARYHGKKGKYVTEPSHLPESSRAYLETTPQSILSQAKFIHVDLESFIKELFEKKGTYENIRRSQGFISSARKEVERIGSKKAHINIQKSLRQIGELNRYKTHDFKKALKDLRNQVAPISPLKIQRQIENHSLRHTKNNPIEKGDDNESRSNEKYYDGTQATRHVL